MKATIEFNLPDERTEFEMAAAAGDMYLAMWDVDAELRQLLKHGGNTTEVIESCRARLNEILGRWA